MDSHSGGTWKGKLGLVVLVMAAGACRPVLTVGWGEVLLIGGVLLIVLAPLLIRLARFLTRMEDRGESSRDQES